MKVIGGGTALFPQVDCTCPVFYGSAIADVTGGNMEGSCLPPGSGKIWSLYSPQPEIPQAMNNWIQSGPKAAALPQICSKDLNLGTKIANCFSFTCDSLTYIRGVPVATCHCPMGESLDGKPVPAKTAFFTQAGQGDAAFCAKHPISGPFTVQ